LLPSQQGLSHRAHVVRALLFLPCRIQPSSVMRAACTPPTPLQQLNVLPTVCVPLDPAIAVNSVSIMSSLRHHTLFLHLLTAKRCIFAASRRAPCHPAVFNSIPLAKFMSGSDCGNKIAVGLEPTNLRERARFYADRNQIETAVFFAGNPFFFPIR
jgi:hypothetical protein